ncbi:MAG: hypothetical protein ACO3S3_12445, partial [Pseudohongiellaceae bacterium]
SFNGGGEGREVMFRNGVNFITPNSANNSYLNPLNMTDGYVSSSGSFRAPIFYDSDNTGYYVDPNSTSNLWTLNAFNTGTSINISGHIQTNAGGVKWNENGVRSWNMYPSGGGLLIASGDQAGSFNILESGGTRSRIFYDYDNTAYYTDPASTSVLNALTVNGGAVYRSDWTTRFQSSSDFVNGTLVSTDIPATGFSGNSFVIEITGKSYSASNPPFKAVAQGYLYNNTIINFSGINYGGEFSSYIRVFEDGGVLKFWWPRISYWNSFNVNVMSMDSATNGTITRNRVTSITNSTEPTGSKKQTINLAGFMRSDISATNSVDLRAPIFYDSANTAFFVDPAGGSRLSTTYTDQYYAYGWFRNIYSGYGVYNEATVQHFYSDDGGGWNIAGNGVNSWLRFRDSYGGTVRGYVHATTNNDIGFLNQDGSWRARVV